MVRKQRETIRKMNSDEDADYNEDLELSASGYDQRPIVDPILERDADRAAMVYLRSSNRDSQYLKGYGHAGKGPKGYKKSDVRIREEACEALSECAHVDATNIEVEVNEGCIYLRGQIENRQEKRLAEDVVENIRGVVDVQNELTFKKSMPPFKSEKSHSDNQLGTRLS